MLQLIKRCPEYALGYKEYCQELKKHGKVIYLRQLMKEKLVKKYLLTKEP